MSEKKAKLFYLEGNTIKIIRHVITYEEKVITDTLEKLSTIVQYLNSLESLNNVKANLDRHAITYTVKDMDVTGIQHYDNLIVGNREEAELLISPTVEALKERKLEEIKKATLVALSNGTTVDLHGKSETLPYSQIEQNSFNVTPQDENNVVYNISGEEIALNKADFLATKTIMNDFYNEVIRRSKTLERMVNNYTEVDELNAVSWSTEITPINSKETKTKKKK